MGSKRRGLLIKRSKRGIFHVRSMREIFNVGERYFKWGDDREEEKI